MIALTGGAGFIGSALLWKLNQEQVHDIIVVDRLGTEDKWKNLVGKRFRYLASPDEFLDRLSRGYYSKLDAIIHFGARTNTTERDAEFLAENNYRYSIRLATFAVERGIPFLYASSASVYGAGEKGYSVGNTALLRPLNPYAMSKYLFDCWVEESDLLGSVCGLRFFNVFGPNEYHKGPMASMVYKSFLQIQRTGKVHLFESTTPEYADGEQKRDFVYIKDVVEIVWQILRSQWTDKPIRGIYNVGSGRARSWNELARAVFSALEREPVIVYIPMPDELRHQYQNFTQADLSGLAEALSQHQCSLPTTSLEESVGDYVNGYLLQQWQYL
ncbi:MAG: ADP-glyceromanno-heptose 6-epimerase [Bacteroidota bacterium]|nr:ADP-glyceromanno-heptose 6-epimerase [Candidatus Kapabacteria bacterium]MCX7936744.1 ADP-glyceromanno-heptose 6-epimerase [Chlorobiota bacterium]MDW8074212.1 ADP-glyceromanno-heptose 6-epimerase [Bacteroidota bacterium]MDW8271312.1 ADP-glyceromanno-heptose 6-epimerase [Bacteroidota bacterium]